MKKISFWGNRLFRRSVQLFGSVFYVNPPPDLNRSIFVVGTARSGTTWLGDIIASQISCRSMFEPFNPDLVIAYRQFNYFQYMRPGKTDDQFYNFARKIFTGNIRNNWIDHQNERIFPKYRLIKEIRANLSLKWLHDQFPQVPKFLLIRHPCAVVQSRLSLNWATDLDIQHFLSQPDLIEDHLSTYLDVINGAKTDYEKHAIIWCISNLVPLKQFSRGQIPIIFYENMLIKPDIELPRILPRSITNIRMIFKIR